MPTPPLNHGGPPSVRSFYSAGLSEGETARARAGKVSLTHSRTVHKRSRHHVFSGCRGPKGGSATQAPRRRAVGRSFGFDCRSHTRVARAPKASLHHGTRLWERLPPGWTIDPQGAPECLAPAARSRPARVRTDARPSKWDALSIFDSAQVKQPRLSRPRTPGYLLTYLLRRPGTSVRV